MKKKKDEFRPLPVEFPKTYNTNNRGRRGSVSAEADKEEVKYEKKVIPKSDEAVERIKKAVSTSFLFQGIDSEQRQEIFDAMNEVKVKAGDEIITQGKDGDFFYVVEAGKYEVHKRINGEVKKVFAYDESGSFGELALMYNAPRAASVKATTDGILWAVDRATFRHIIIDSQAKKRQLYETFLDKVPILAHLTKGERSQIADCLETLDYQDGSYVIRQGEKGETFYIVVKGECRATITPEGKTEAIEVNRMKVGSFFGERALLLSQLRAANVIAVGDTRVAGMDRSAFERLLGEVKPEMHKQISEYRRPQ
jgi:cAMP-dependent protein kinase regulator